MNKPLVMISLATALSAAPAFADRDTLDAAIGGGLGGAAGAAIGNEIGRGRCRRCRDQHRPP